MNASDRARGGRADPASPHARKRSLRRRRPSLTLTLDQLSGGAVLVDGESRIVAANENAARMFACAPEDLVGRPLEHMIPEWPALQVRLGIPSRRRSQRLVTQGRRAHGDVFPLRVSQSATRSRGVVQVLIFLDDMTRRRGLAEAAQDSRRALTDVTERERSQQELGRSQVRLQAALRAAAIGTWIWEFQDDHVFWDDAMYTLWGRKRDDKPLTGQQMGALILEEDRERVRLQAKDFLASGSPDITHEFRIRHPDGSVRWMSITGRVENDAQGRVARVIGACMDVTARKHSEHTQRHSQKIEALGTLAGGIAHDFNNILLAITGNARLGMADLPADHPVRRDLAEIEKASARATNLVHRILAFSRQSEPMRQIVPLRPTIEEALKLLRATLPAMIEIKGRFDYDLPPVHADTTQIHQVIMNLVTNSAHAIGDETGTITVAVETEEMHERSAATRELKPGTYLHVCVSDTGRGMDEATVERIFDPFFTTKPAGQGTGLGLSVVHGIVRSHDGMITVESRPGKGTTFHLYFPAAMRAAESATEVQRAAAQGSGQRVMYVDDEDSLVYLATRMLARLGYRVSGYTDPGEALREFGKHPRDFDVVVTDVSMPGMSGFHFARGLLAIRPDVPVLMTSGYVRQQDRDAAQSLGIRDVILKPNTVEELAHALARLFEETRKK